MYLSTPNYRHLLFFFLSFLIFFSGQAQSFDTLAAPGIKAAGNSTTGWIDVNSDGYLDLLVIGEESAGVYSTKLYMNAGGISFSLSPENLPVVSPVNASSRVQMQFHDFNNDNRVDIFLLGKVASGSTSLVILENLKTGGFKEVTHTIPVQANSRFILGDFNNNGNVELIITSLSVPTQIYAYRGGLFKLSASTGLPQAGSAILLPFDFNKDSQLDLFLLGTDAANKPIADIFFNTGNLTFAASGQKIAPLNYTSAALLDYNEDGDFDVVLTGKNAAGLAVGEIYTYKENELSATDVDFTAILPQQVYTGDLDNDGKMDIIFTGKETTSQKPVTKVFNWKDSKLVTSDTVLPAFSEPALALADFDNDYSLDLFITGAKTNTPESFLLLNTPQKENKPPYFPFDLFNIVDGDTIRLYWQMPTDNTTKARSLTYSVDIKQIMGDSILISPLINMGNTRKVVSFGQQSTNTELKLWNLPQGSYTWTVKAIDNSYISSRLMPGGGGGSGGAGGITSINCPLVFSVYRATPLEVCENETVKIQPAVLNGKVATWSSTSQGPLGTGAFISFKAKKTGIIIARLLLPGGCYETFTFPIKVNASPKIVLPDQLTICPKEEVKLEVTAPESTIAWISVKKGNLGTASLLTFKPEESDKIYVVITNGKGCAVKDSVIITVRSPIAISAGPDYEICPRESVKIGPGTEINETDFTFTWSPAIGLDKVNSKNAMARPMVTTQYYIKAINKVTGCFGIDSVIVKVKEKRVIKPGPDRAICLGDATELGGAPTASGLDPVFQYIWSPAEGLSSTTISNPIAKPTATTKYRVIVSSVSCPSDTAYVTVKVNQPPPSGNVTNHSIMAGEGVTLQASGGVSYKWSPTTGLSDPQIAAPIASPMVPTTYTVEITDANGCKGTNQYQVDVKYTVFVPNVFSPNGDGNNDTFKVYGPGIKSVVFQVFTRSGQLLFEADNINSALGSGWDGRYKGEEQPSGTYVWSLSGELSDGSKVSYEGKNSGIFTLIR